MVVATRRMEGAVAMEDSCVVEMMIKTKKIVAWDSLIRLDIVNLLFQVRVDVRKRWWVNFFLNSLQMEMSMM